MHEQIIFAGFGGQGIQSMSLILSKAAMGEGLEVSWMPAYGGAMRGGTSNVTVIVSDKLIGSPMPDVGEITAAVVMNNPSLAMFEEYLKPGGLLLVNSSLIDIKPKRTDIEIINIPANDIAIDIQNDKAANLVMLGTLIKRKNIIDISVLKDYVEAVFKSKPEVTKTNLLAIDRGVEYAKKELSKA